LAEQSIQQNPRQASNWNILALARYRLGDYPAALAALEKAESLRPEGHAADWFVSALIHWQLSKPDRAVTDYRQGVNWMAKHALTDYELPILRDEAATWLKLEAKDSTQRD
jgi:tetratricopeptide (TPR) repeat protein